MADFNQSEPHSENEVLSSDDIWARLASETARIEWSELEKFFARGQVVAVGESLDLVDVAVAVVNDDRERVSEWMQAEQFGVLDAATARLWAGGDAPDLWAVVVAPWVLVQPR